MEDTHHNVHNTKPAWIEEASSLNPPPPSRRTDHQVDLSSEAPMMGYTTETSAGMWGRPRLGKDSDTVPRRRMSDPAGFRMQARECLGVQPISLMTGVIGPLPISPIARSARRGWLDGSSVRSFLKVL